MKEGVVRAWRKPPPARGRRGDAHHSRRRSGAGAVGGCGLPLGSGGAGAASLRQARAPGSDGRGWRLSPAGHVRPSLPSLPSAPGGSVRSVLHGWPCRALGPFWACWPREAEHGPGSAGPGAVESAQAPRPFRPCLFRLSRRCRRRSRVPGWRGRGRSPGRPCAAARGGRGGTTRSAAWSVRWSPRRAWPGRAAPRWSRGRP